MRYLILVTLLISGCGRSLNDYCEKEKGITDADYGAHTAAGQFENRAEGTARTVMWYYPQAGFVKFFDPVSDEGKSYSCKVSYIVTDGQLFIAKCKRAECVGAVGSIIIVK